MKAYLQPFFICANNRLPRHLQSVFRLVACIVVLTSCAVQQSNAQAPGISYSSPQAYYIGQTLTPLVPANSGGSVPATVIGKVITYAGTGTAGSANNSTPLTSTFSSPYNLVFDSSGNLYITCGGDGTIRKITTGGTVSTFASGLNNPTGIAIDGSNNIYVAERASYCITKITSGGTKSTYAGTSGSYGYKDGAASAAQFRDMTGLLYDGSANLYVVDCYNQLIRKINLTSNIVSTVAGTALTTGTTNGAAVGTAEFSYPTGIALDPTDTYLYVADQGNNEIRTINLTTNMVSTLAGNTTGGYADGTGTSAQFDAALEITTDAAGMIYVGDQFNHRIRKITPAGVVTTLAGNGTAISTDGTGNSASFNVPDGLAFNSAGDLFVADNVADNIRKLEVYGYIISPSLPGGLSFDVTTGIISGTATVAAAAASYTATAYNYSGSSSAAVNIAVTAQSAPAISYTSPSYFTVNAVATPLAPVAGNINAIGFAAPVTIASGFASLTTLAVNASGNIYLTDNTTSGELIREIPAGGTLTNLSPDYAGLTGIVADASGNVYMSTSTAVINLTSSTIYASGFNNIIGLAIDAAGNIYVWPMQRWEL